MAKLDERDIALARDASSGDAKAAAALKFAHRVMVMLRNVSCVAVCAKPMRSGSSAVGNSLFQFAKDSLAHKRHSAQRHTALDCAAVQ